jgi:hypothetical protein
MEISKKNIRDLAQTPREKSSGFKTFSGIFTHQFPRFFSVYIFSV